VIRETCKPQYAAPTELTPILDTASYKDFAPDGAEPGPFFYQDVGLKPGLKPQAGSCHPFGISSTSASEAQRNNALPAVTRRSTPRPETWYPPRHTVAKLDVLVSELPPQSWFFVNHNKEVGN